MAKASFHHHLPLLLVLLLLPSPFAAAASTPASPVDPLDSSKQVCWGCMSETRDFLFAHNLVRAAHNEAPLSWDGGLEARARWWALQRRHDCRLEHSFPEGGFTLGENIFWGEGSRWAPQDAVRDWADEERSYSYLSNSCLPGEDCGHYTQLVWRNTWRVGCARQPCDNGDVFMVCNYSPPGNVVGQRPY